MRMAIALPAVAAALLTFAACQDERAPSITSTTSAGMVTTDNAVSHLAARRCDHEIDCQNVGAGKRYDDRGGCEREIAHALQAELAPSKCIWGVREEMLDRCMAGIRGHSCAISIESLESVASCKRATLCIN